jgi:hypothetical protein
VKSAVPSAAISSRQGGGLSVRRLLEIPTEARFSCEKPSACDRGRSRCAGKCAAIATINLGLPAADPVPFTTRASQDSAGSRRSRTSPWNDGKRRDKIVSRTRMPCLADGTEMCDNVTHEGDLNQGAPPTHRRVGASSAKARLDSRPRSTRAGRQADPRQRRASDQCLRAMETVEAIRESPRPPGRRDARRGNYQLRSRSLKPSPCLRQPPRISMRHWLRSST